MPRIHAAVSTGSEVNSPLFAGFFPASNVVESAIGELINTVYLRHTAYREGGPGTAAFADSVIQWMVDIVGLGERAHGALTTGGSNAILSAMIGARERFIVGGGDLSRARVYASDQTHHCIRRALHFAVISFHAIQVIATKNTRLEPRDMELAIEKDLASGHQPMLVVGTAGTTNTGNVEPLQALAKLAAQYGMWYHVDGCYGALFALTDRGRKQLRGIDRADSVSLDPYKTLFFPFGVAALLVRDAKSFGALLSPTEKSEYLRDNTAAPANDGDNSTPHNADETTFSPCPEPTDMSTELTTEARGLRMWLPLHLHGVKVYRDLLDSRLDLADYFCKCLKSLPPVQLPVRPDLGVVIARLEGPQERTDEWLRLLKSSRTFFFSSTEVEGQAVFRISLGNRRMWKKEVDVIRALSGSVLVDMGLM